MGRLNIGSLKIVRAATAYSTATDEVVETETLAGEEEMPEDPIPREETETDFASDSDSDSGSDASDASTAYWEGVLVVEGTPTGDGRLIEKGGLRWDVSLEEPLLIRHVQEDVGAHDGAQVVGRIYEIWREESGEIWARGDFDLGSEVGREAFRQVKENLTRGVSVDLDDVSFEVRAPRPNLESPDGDEATAESEDEDGRIQVHKQESGEEMFVTTDARIRAATLVATPAFAEAKINVTESLATPSDEAEEDDEDDDLDEDEAAEVEEVEDSDEELDDEDKEIVGKLSDDSDDSDSEYNWVDDVGGLPKYIKRISDALQRRGFSESRAIATAVNQVKRWARGGDGVKASTRAKAAKAVAEWEAKKARAKADSAETVTASVTDDAEIEAGDGEAQDLVELIAAAAPQHPPKDWFADPGLEGSTAFVVDDDGRVFGHAATWDVCHIGDPAGKGNCVTAPSSATGYAYFHTGVTRTEEGVDVAVGHITMGTGHAGPKLKHAAAAEHYDNNGSVVADVRAGEDAYGIWVAGALRPGVTEDQVRALRSSPISGDWRSIAGNLEMVAALAVNVPGFPIPRPSGMVSSGATVSLVAAGVIGEDGEHGDHDQHGAEEQSLGALDGTQAFTPEEISRLKRIIVEDRRQESEKLAAKVRESRAQMNRRKVESFRARKEES